MISEGSCDTEDFMAFENSALHQRNYVIIFLNIKLNNSCLNDISTLAYIQARLRYIHIYG